MRTRFRRCGLALTSALLQVCLLTLAAGHLCHPNAAAALGAPVSADDHWPRVAIADNLIRLAVQSGLDGASQWLANSHCQPVLQEFHDEQGCPLAEKLVALGINGPGYLRWVLIRDGSSRTQCAGKNRLAFTTPGSRIVFVCGRAFERTWRRDPEKGQAVLIHELLHTLGLGENPPTSEYITNRVLELCASNGS